MSESNRTGTGAVLVRPWRPADEAAVRELCYTTGCLGRPADLWIDANRALFTDFWLAYYFEREPGALFVAERNGRLAGYLAGCLDTRAKRRWMRRVFGPRLLRGLLAGRYRFGPRTMRVLARLALDGLRHGYPRVPWRTYPAHLHYNVAEEERTAGARTGIRLAAAFARHLRERGRQGFHGVVALPAGRAPRRYGVTGRVVDARPTTAFRDVDARPMRVAVVTCDLDGLPPLGRRIVAAAGREGGGGP